MIFQWGSVMEDDNQFSNYLVEHHKKINKITQDEKEYDLLRMDVTDLVLKKVNYSRGNDENLLLKIFQDHKPGNLC